MKTFKDFLGEAFNRTKHAEKLKDINAEIATHQKNYEAARAVMWHHEGKLKKAKDKWKGHKAKDPKWAAAEQKRNDFNWKNHAGEPGRTAGYGTQGGK